MPPFTDEHEELRESRAPLRLARRSPPTSTSGRRRGSSRASCSPAAASSASWASSSPSEYGGQGGTHLHDAVWIEELSRSGGSGGVAAGLNAHAQIAMPPVFNFGTEEQRRRWIVPGIRGELVGALGITEPGAGSNVADIRTTARRVAGRLRRQRLEDLHHQRRPGRLPGLRREDQPRRRPPRPLVPGAGARDARLRGDHASWRRWAGTPRTPASCRSPTSRSRRRTCSGTRTRAST